MKRSYRRNKIVDKRGSVTPFVIIIATTFLSIFIIMFSSIQQLSYNNTQNDYLIVASDDLLSSFDEQLLTDYGLLAYNRENALEKVKKALVTNSVANQNSYFIKEDLEQETIEFVQYNSIETLDNKISVANAAIAIAKIHVPKEAVEELNKIYDWSNLMKTKVQSYDKYNKITKKLETFTKKLEKCTKEIKKLNKLEKYAYEKLYDYDSARANQELLSIKKKYIDALRKIDSFQNSLDDFSRNITPVDENIGELNALDFMSDVEVSVKRFQKALSGKEYTVDEMKENIQANIEVIEEMRDHGDYDLFETLNTDFYIYEDDENDDYLKSIMFHLKELCESEDDIVLEDFDYSVWCTTVDSNERMKLAIYEKILLNEYFLATLKSRVESPVRNFSILSRDKRESAYSNGEVEFLITETNKKSSISFKIYGLRMGPNTIHLLTDKEKFRIIKGAGEKIASINPIAGVLASVVITGGWASAESLYDLKELENGRGVPFIKTDATWHFDFDFDQLKKIEKKTANKKITIEKNKDDIVQSSMPQGLSYYNDYLRILLFFTNDNKKMDRYLEVISKNRRRVLNEIFDPSDYVIEHEINWNGNYVNGGYYDEKN